MSTNSKSTFLEQLLLVGIAGPSAVTIQTISLVWANNVLKKQKIHGLNLFKSILKVYQKGGIRSFFKGSLTPFIYNSFARFGDLSSNFYVLRFFKNNTISSKTPLFIQTLFSWGLSSIWRIAITPLTIIAIPKNFMQFKKMRPKYRMARSYSKFIKPQIFSLYSWFLVQNYLIQYSTPIKYSDGPIKAWIRYASFGFLSMITYDCYLKLKNTVWPPQLPSRYQFNKVFFKGLYGVVFCTSSQFIKEKLDNHIN